MKCERWIRKLRVGARVALASVVMTASLSSSAAEDPAVNSTPVTMGASGHRVSSTDASAERLPADGAVPQVHERKVPNRRTAAQSIDDTARRIAVGLELDAEQQSKLRRILWDQHRAILALRGGQFYERNDAVGSALAIYDRSKALIREMLNDEQRAKYSSDPPRDALAQAQAELTYWLDVQGSKKSRPQGMEAPK